MHILFVVSEARITSLDHTGFIGAAIRDGGGSVDWVHCFDGHPLPANASGHDGLVLSGGEMSVFDDMQADYIRRLSELYLAFRAEGKPVLGSCLGAQIMAHALGAPVERMEHMEFGFEVLRTTAAAASDPVFAAVAGEWRIFEAHRDRFGLPSVAVPLMVGCNEPNQVFRVDPLGYGFQCHFEVTRELLFKWTAMMEEELLPWLGENGAERIERVRREADCVMPQSEEFARKVMAGWMGLFDG